MNQPLIQSIRRYEIFIGNIQWHIRTNHPSQNECEKLEKEMEVYQTFLTELKQIEASQETFFDGVKRAFNRHRESLLTIKIPKDDKNNTHRVEKSLTELNSLDLLINLK